jgi:DNA-binding response OmpR family regulator
MKGLQRVLAVSSADDLDFKAIAKALASEKMDLVRLNNIAEARQWIYSEGLPHLILIDLAGAGPEGWGFSEEMYQIANTPIILISEKEDDSTETALTALKHADDFVRRTYATSEELGMRIRRVLSRIQNFSYATGPQVKVTDWLSVDHVKRQVIVNGEARTLTPTENALLGVLLAHRGSVVDADTLIKRVWQLNPSIKDRNALRVHMHRLRNKIEPDPNNPFMITTTRGNGYCLAED